MSSFGLRACLLLSTMSLFAACGGATSTVVLTITSKDTLAAVNHVHLEISRQSDPATVRSVDVRIDGSLPPSRETSLVFDGSVEENIVFAATARAADEQVLASGQTFVAVHPGEVATATLTFGVEQVPGHKLVFAAQPMSGAVGAPLGFSVQTEDDQGKLLVDPVDVSVVLMKNPGQAVLLGTRTMKTTGGVAAFSDLRLDAAGSGYTLLGSAPGFGEVESAPFDQAAGALPQLSQDPVGGKVTGLVEHGGQLVALTEEGGPFRSGDGGLTWSPAHQGLKSPYGYALTSAQKLDAATGKDFHLYFLNDTLYRSDNLGSTWVPLAGAPKGIVSISSFGQWVLVSLDAPSYAVWVSSDFGNTFSVTNAPVSGSGIFSQVGIGAASAVLEVANDGIYSAPLPGLTTWTKVHGFVAIDSFQGDASGASFLCPAGSELDRFTAPSTFASIGTSWPSLTTAFGGSEGPAGTIYAATRKGVYRSIGNGNWTALTNGLDTLDVRSVLVSGTSATTLWAGSSERGVYRSTDGAANWSLQSKGLTADPLLGLARAAGATNKVLARSASGGLFSSTDGGATWAHLPHAYQESGIALVRNVVVDRTSPDRLLLGAMDGVLKSEDGGQSWSPFSADVADTAGYVAQDPSDASTFYACFLGGLFKKTGLANWSALVKSSGFSFDGFCSGLTIHPTDSRKLWMSRPGGPAAVWRSEDGGGKWTAASLGTRTPDAVALDATDQGLLFVTDHEAIYRSTDGGVSFTAITNGLPGGVGYSAVTTHPSAHGVVYVGTRGMGVYRSIDGGSSFSSFDATTNAQFVSAISIDPANPRAVLIATSTDGVWRTSAP